MYKCCCGDLGVAISEERQQESYLQGAYWASGVLSMLDFSGATKYVFNPFSFAELKSKLGNMDVYLQCVSTVNDDSCIPPSDPVFDQQQIPLLSVYQKVLSNYDQKVWDQGTFLLWDEALQKKLKLNIPDVVDTFNVSGCLLEAQKNQWDNGACLRDYFLKGVDPRDYFVYSNITELNPSSEKVHACLTFSGPAAHPDPAIAMPFTACLESFANRSGCSVPAIIWSGKSSSKVPVSAPHTLLTDAESRRRVAMGEVEAVRANVLAVLDKIQKSWTGDGIEIAIFSAEGDLLHQVGDCYMQGAMSEMVLTPGPDGVEKVVWARDSTGETRKFELPCSQEQLTQRNGVRDSKSPFSCGSHARRSIMRHFIRDHLGGGKNNSAGKSMVVKAVQDLLNRTRAAWAMQDNFMCTCANGTRGWNCCLEQSNCATEACPCPAGFEVKQSVACCTSVCGGLAGAGLMDTFTSIKGSDLASELLQQLTEYLRTAIWTSNDPWLKYDPLGKEAYQASWEAQRAVLVDAGMFQTTEPVVYYDEIAYPFKTNTTMWSTCAGLLQQVFWTMPLDRSTNKPRMPSAPYDPINGESGTPNITYKEEFIQSLTLEAFKQSPVYWSYALRYIPSSSEVCARSTGRRPVTSTFKVGDATATKFGFSSYTLGGLGGVDCHCGWWDADLPTLTTCRIPNTTCARMVQLLGFNRICITQKAKYNFTDHYLVLDALEALIKKDPNAPYSCPALQLSDHWGLMGSDGLPFSNATYAILTEGEGGLRVGSVAWIQANQALLVNSRTRVDRMERNANAKASLTCGWVDTSVADHFIDELFPAAQGVRQSAPESYCTRFGIELARQTVYQAAGLEASAGQQRGVVDKWRRRCELKLQQLAVCKVFQVLNATGAPQGTSHCPFSVSTTVALKSSYAVTPGCLIILWNSAQAGIYDPCVCVSCKGQSVDVPGDLTTLCKLQDVQSLVGDTVIPGEIPGVEIPIGSGSFMDLLTKADRFNVNTPATDIRHWAVQTSILDADMLVDWWPDAWRHPVGYHVTPGCSLTGDAHWKTFNSSWRWDDQLETMVFERAVTDPLLRRNAFGAVGVCRTTNFGMPMTMLNTMRVCTRENANARADPMVPKRADPAWVDGAEYCASSPFSTPWNWSKALSLPRQWSVGTMMADVLEPFFATEWGPSCGPYPLQTCMVDGECATGLVCLKARGTTGVCGKITSGSFECAMHSQCAANRLCSGDGLCVEGVWQVKNSWNQSVSFRSHSQACPTGDPLDAWGTSSMENIPDILNASGLCSYRAWYENKKMSERNLCTNTDTCGGFSGVRAWNFTSPRMVSQADSFTDGVLKVQAHVCDRNYQHLDSGFVSCTPNDNYFQLRSATGNVMSKPSSGYARGIRTRTYQVGTRVLPLMHHVENNRGATYGFTGIPLTYADLKLDTASPSIMACRNMRVCGFQKDFRVNGVMVSQRFVLDNNVARGYTMTDLIGCGVFGYQQQASSICKIDYAVAPLAKLLLSGFGGWNTAAAFTTIRGNIPSDQYTTDRKEFILAGLSALPGVVLASHIGGSPTTLQEYIDRSSKFVDIFNAMKAIINPSYVADGVDQARQLYYLTLYGAYEVPFAWFFKCVWLMSFPMDTGPVSSEQCGWSTDGNPGLGTQFDPYDNRIAGLFGLPGTTTSSQRKVSLRSLLLKLPGVLTQAIQTAALQDFKARRNEWYDRFLGLLKERVAMMCYKHKEFVEGFSSRSTSYQLNRIKQAYMDGVFDLSQNYLDDNTLEMVCRNVSCVESTGFSTSLVYGGNFTAMVEAALKAPDVTMPAMSLDSTMVPDRDQVVLGMLSNAIPSSAWTTMLNAFENKPAGCSTVATLFNSPTACLCSKWSGCTAGVQQKILSKQGMSNPQPSVAPMVQFYDNHNVLLRELNACDGLVCGANCSDAEVMYRGIYSVELPPGVEMETYSEFPWDCTLLTCADTASPLHNTVIPTPFVESPTILNEKFVIEEYNFTQTISGARTNQWTDATEAKERAYLAMYMSKGDLMFDVGCKDTGGYPCFDTRSVAAVKAVVFNVKVLRYYVSSKLKSTITFFPCGFDPDFASTLWPNLQTTYARATRIPGIQCVVAGGKARPNFAVYDSVYVDMAVPATSTTQESQLDYVLQRARTVIGNLEEGMGEDDTCLDYGGTCTVTVGDKESGTVRSVEWTTDLNEKKCETLKADMVFGCNMFPGESTFYVDRCMDVHKVDQNLPPPFSFHCGRGPYSTEDYFRDPNVNGCGCKSYNQYYHPHMAECLTSDPGDKCKGGNRDMQLVGRTLTYTYSTIIVPCTAGPTKQCKLVNESATYASTPFAVCPGQSSDVFAVNRRTDYFTVSSVGHLRTRVAIDMFVSAEGRTPVSPFDHMYLALQPNRTKSKPAFACGSCFTNGRCIPCENQDRTPPVCATETLAVEMRTNLWTCLDCLKVTSRYCTGDHNCKLTSLGLAAENLNTLDGWNGLPASTQQFLLDSPAPIATVLSAVQWLANQTVSLGITGVGMSYSIPEFMRPAQYQQSYSYNPLQVIAYNTYMGDVASTCTTTGTVPDFSNCSFDDRRRNLKRFAQVNYNVNDGVVIDQGVTLMWKVLRTQMTQDNIPAWEASSNKAGLFVTELFSDKWCLKGNMADNICYSRTVNSKLVVDVLNPGLLGAFEPLAGCDVELRDSSRVVSSACGACDANANNINGIENGASMLCTDGLSVRGMSESQSAPSNLCGKTPAYASECLNPQGTLSRAQEAFDGTPVGNLYARIPWAMVSKLPSGLSDNVLFRGKAPTDAGMMSNLGLSPYDIGGHFVRMELAASSLPGKPPVLKVVRMPLGSYTDALGDAAFLLGQPELSTANLQWMTYSQTSEADAFRSLYPDPKCTSWDCPLRRRAFYHGKDERFRPVYPDPGRTQVLYGSKVHPTQRAARLNMKYVRDGTAVLGAYKTYNGFCACRTPPCTGCATDLDALMGGWRASSVLAGGECSQQVDWPYPGGTLRDESTIVERYQPPSCGLLNRLPVFQYRYWNSGATIPSAATTLDRGGVCSMGWPIVTSGALDPACYLIVESDLVICPGKLPQAVVRMKPRTLASLLFSKSRSRLTECRMPPSYQFPSGASTASEVSYGQLKRLEASRLLAIDLRRRLCGNATTCAASKDWTLPTFWANVFAKDFPVIPSGDNANATLWDEPWVACLQDPNGTMQCDGTVSREEWLSTKTRGSACVNALTKSKFAGNLTRDINVCDLDSTLDQFCRTIQDGRYQVYEANCMYSGQCRQQLYFYQPSTYAVDNGEFVRSTVQRFYNNSVAGACIPDIDTAKALEDTARALEKCAAIQLNILVDAIKIIRIIMDSLVELVFYVAKLALMVFQLIGESAAKQQETVRGINALLTLIKNKFLTVFNQFGNLLYRVVMSGPMGAWLQGAITFMCNLLSTFISDVVYVVLCWTREACIGFLRYVAAPIVSVLATVTFGKLDYLQNDVESAIGVIKSNIPCSKTTMFSCDIKFREAEKPTSVLPAATRCWVGVEPGIGSLACSPADTCLSDDFSLVNCGVCQGASSMIKYGCDTLTKLCSCNVFPRGVSSCTSHEECTIDSNDVDCQYVDSYLEPSYGNVPCRQCSTQPICLISDGTGVGQCSCLLRPVSNQMCTDVGERVSPNAAQLCLVTGSSGSNTALSTSNSYSTSYRTLASAPCTILNQAQTYCMRVYTSASVSLSLVVGLSLLQRRRRLLEDGWLLETPLLTNSSDWSGEGQPCRALVQSNGTDLGIVDRYYRSECWRWKDIGTKIVSDENMTHVSPYFLVSWRDLLYAMLTPDSITEIAAKLPKIINGLLLHSEVTQPLYVAALYWTRLLPVEMWSNDTMLDKTRSFFRNQTFYFNGPTPQEPIPRPIGNSTGRRLFSITDTLTSDTAYDWSKGPYQWPPNYQYWNNNGKPSCAIVSTALGVFKHALNTTFVSYRASRPELLPITWPEILPLAANFTFALNTTDAEGMLGSLTTAWLDKDRLAGFIADASWVRYLKSFIQCDFEAIQTCSKRRSLMWSALQVVVIFLCISFAARILGIPYVDFLLALFFIPWVLYAAYGYAFTCAPLVPVCLLQDVFDLVDWLLPSSIAWPRELETTEFCTSPACMRPCRTDPVVGFARWEDHVAWLVCEVDPKMGLNLASSITWDSLTPLRTSLNAKCGLWAESESMRGAQRVCWAITAVNSTPALLAIAAGMWLLPSLLGMVLAVAQFAVNAVVSMLLFSHSGAE